VTSHRANGVVLYSLAVVLLLGGELWFFRAAPELGPDPRLAVWRAAVARVVPDLAAQVTAATMELGAAAPSSERLDGLESGAYTLMVACAGDPVGRIRIRLSETGDDSGRAVQCAENPTAVTLTVALADTFVMLVSAETAGRPAVFRWRLTLSRIP
jgi:uncharacterized protein DUF6023